MSRPLVAAEVDLGVIDDLDEIVRFVERSTGRVYVRYSRGPEHDRDGPSVDYESGLTLPGLSVTVLNPPDWWARPTEDWVARRICKYAELLQGPGDRKPWLLTGEVAGVGPDHEPLVVEAHPVAYIGPQALAQAVQVYFDRFDVARDSRG